MFICVLTYFQGVSTSVGWLMRKDLIINKVINLIINNVSIKFLFFDNRLHK
jgi:hypothetical protein